MINAIFRSRDDAPLWGVTGVQEFRSADNSFDYE
jgi:hypothetical protein